MILFQIFSVPLSWVSFSSSISFILSFGLIIESYISFMFCPRDYRFNISFDQVISLLPSIPHILFIIYYNLFVSLVSEVPLWDPKYFPKFPSIWVFFIGFIFTFKAWIVSLIFFYSLCFPRLFNGFIHFLLDEIYHIYKGYFKALILYFSYVKIFSISMVGLLASSGYIVSWIVLILSLCLHQGIWFGKTQC